MVLCEIVDFLGCGRIFFGRFLFTFCRDNGNLFFKIKLIIFLTLYFVFFRYNLIKLFFKLGNKFFIVVIIEFNFIFVFIGV